MNPREFQLMSGYLIGTAKKGALIGEVSMTYNEDPKKNKRLFSGVSKSEFSIVVSLNSLVFGILVKEKLRKDSEILAKFIYKSIPGLHKCYTFNKVMGHANHLFYKKDLCKNEIILKAGEESTCIYVICSGQVSLYKKVKYKSLNGN